MTYRYSRNNILVSPQSYMYTPFEGNILLNHYLESRFTFLKQLEECHFQNIENDGLFARHTLLAIKQSCRVDISDIEMLKDENDVLNLKEISDLNNMASELPLFSMINKVNTQTLLDAVVASLLMDNPNVLTKTWLDRLVQRFEVSKRLYETYHAGFRKGEGEYTVIRLYCLLALALNLFYIKTLQLKYLSTLLKVCDLLCSLPVQTLSGQVSRFVLDLIIITEISYVKLLCNNKGVDLETS